MSSWVLILCLWRAFLISQKVFGIFSLFLVYWHLMMICSMWVFFFFYLVLLKPICKAFMSYFNLETWVLWFWNFSWIIFHNCFASFSSIFFYFYYSNCISSLFFNYFSSVFSSFSYLSLPQLPGRFSQSYLPTLSFPFLLSDFSIILVSWSLSTHIPPVYMGDTQRHWVTPWNGPQHNIKYQFQLKTEERVWRGYCKPGK